MGGGGSVLACFSLFGRMAAFAGERSWLGCCTQANALIDRVWTVCRQSGSNSAKASPTRAIYEMGCNSISIPRAAWPGIAAPVPAE
jgi:hypothetical protein